MLRSHHPHLGKIPKCEPETFPTVEGFSGLSDWLAAGRGPMPRYYIDTNDGEQTHRDTDGYYYPDDQTARKAAISHLTDIAGDVLPEGAKRTMSVLLRDRQYKPIFKATTDLSSMWLEMAHDRCVKRYFL